LPDTLVLADAGRLPGGPTWGTDSIPDTSEPDEALGWVTLVRLLGWSATIGDRDADGALGGGQGVMIVSGPPEELPAGRLAELRDAVHSRPRLVVAAAGTHDGEWRRLTGTARRPIQRDASRGAGRLTWCGPGPPAAWNPVAGLDAMPLDIESDVEVWATLDGLPLIAARRLGAGSVIATLAFDVGRARAATAAATALLKRLLTCGCPFPTAWLDLAGTLVLRMDDPGASANVHLRAWSYAKLGERDWSMVGAALQARGARLSVAYTPGWVDDGDPGRGMLDVDGDAVPRVAGAIHPSPLVLHVDRGGNCPGRINDYRAEFRGIAKLQAARLVGVEQHGYTHMPADLSAWARAPDRYDNVAWYREFTPQDDRAASDRERPVALGAALIRQYFGCPPTALVCPGQASTEAAIGDALEAGLRLVSTGRLALRDGGRFCWCAGVPVVYLDRPDPSTLESELPAVGYFHDYELATIGVEWLSVQLDAWRKAGVRRFIDLRELAAALALRLDLAPDGIGGWRLTADADPDLPFPRPLPVMLRASAGEPPRDVEICSHGGRQSVQRLGDGLGRLVLPVDGQARAAEPSRRAARASPRAGRAPTATAPRSRRGRRPDAR
jgi:hypothetical protein